jgi:hypothetical protein
MMQRHEERIADVFGCFSEAKHFRTKPDRDGFNRAIKTAGATVPALFRIFDHRKLLFLIKMDYIQGAM